MVSGVVWLQVHVDPTNLNMTTALFVRDAQGKIVLRGPVFMLISTIEREDVALTPSEIEQFDRWPTLEMMFSIIGNRPRPKEINYPGVRMAKPLFPAEWSLWNGKLCEGLKRIDVILETGEERCFEPPPGIGPFQWTP